MGVSSSWPCTCISMTLSIDVMVELSTVILELVESLGDAGGMGVTAPLLGGCWSVSVSVVSVV